MKELWPHQERAVEELPDLLTPGRREVMTSPTGGGKSEIMRRLIRLFGSVTLYTNRRMLLNQLGEAMHEDGIDFGVRMAGCEPDLHKPVQLCSIQTAVARSHKRTLWDMPKSRLVLIDEAHINRESQMQWLCEQHLKHGAAILGVTATPVDIGHMYEHLYVAGTNSELRECGALVPAVHYAPDEPDTRNLKRTKTGEFTEGDTRKAIMSPTIVGRVVENYEKLNPNRVPTVMFAPGVKESIWLAEQLCKAGIPSAHIDGEKVWVDGEFYASNDDTRGLVREQLQSGILKVVSNRFVLREGIDWPFVEHCIFATIFGSPASLLQSGGRVLRSYPGKTRATIQDHGGNWHRHGSLNADREWTLGDSAYMIAEMREQRLKEKKEREPITCPKCHMVRMTGAACSGCGFVNSTKSRIVVQKDGTLKHVQGDVYRKPRPDRSPRDVCIKRWESCYWSVKRRGGTFREAIGLYHYRHDWVAPPTDLPLMPTTGRDWFQPIDKVPISQLIPKEAAHEGLYPVS